MRAFANLNPSVMKQEYVSLAVRLGADQGFRKEAVAKVQAAYRVLHRHQQSAREWTAFFVRAHRSTIITDDTNNNLDQDKDT